MVVFVLVISIVLRENLSRARRRSEQHHRSEAPQESGFHALSFPLGSTGHPLTAPIGLRGLEGDASGSVGNEADPILSPSRDYLESRF